MKAIGTMMLGLLFLSAPAGAGELFDALKGACLASGGGDRFLSVASVTQTCAESCAATACGTTAQCEKGWTVWQGSSYQYGSECSSTAGGAAYNPTGRLCCCTSTGCAMPTSVGSYPY